MTQVFESERIRFVKITEALLADYLAMVNDMERVAPFIGRRTEPFTEAQELAWVRKKQADDGPYFSMIEKECGDFIGNIELMDVHDDVGELGIAITAAKQDMGFGTEAIPAMVRYGMERLGLRRVFLKVYPENARALHVYEKCGFREYNRTDTDIFMEIVR